MQLLKSLNYAKDISQAEAELDQGNYKACLISCRRLVENALKDLYRQLLLAFKPEDSRRVREIEARKGSGHFERFTFGQMVGLFEECRLYDFLRLIEIPGNKLKSIRLDDVLQYGNEAAHGSSEVGKYEAADAFSTTRKFLKASGFLEQRKTLYTEIEVFRELLSLTRHAGIEASEYLNGKADTFQISRQQEAELRREVEQQYLSQLKQVQDQWQQRIQADRSEPEEGAETEQENVVSTIANSEVQLPEQPAPADLPSVPAEPVADSRTIAEMKVALGQQFITPEVFIHPNLIRLRLNLALQQHRYARAGQFKYWANYIAGLALTYSGKAQFSAAEIQRILQEELLPEHFGKAGAAHGSLLTSDVEINSVYQRGLASLERVGSGQYRFIGYQEELEVETEEPSEPESASGLPELQQGGIYTSYAKQPERLRYYCVADGPLPLAETNGQSCLLTTYGVQVPKVLTPRVYLLVDITQKDDTLGPVGKAPDGRLYAVYSASHEGYRVLWIPPSGVVENGAWNKTLLEPYDSSSQGEAV